MKGVFDGGIRPLAAPGQAALVQRSGEQLVLPLVADLDPAFLAAPEGDVRKPLGGRFVTGLLPGHAAPPSFARGLASCPPTAGAVPLAKARRCLALARVALLHHGSQEQSVLQQDLLDTL